MSAAKKIRARIAPSVEDAEDPRVDSAFRSDRSSRRVGDCGCADPDAPKIADYARSPAETLALTVVRAHLALQAHGSYACLDAAHSLAETQFEATAAADFVARITLLLRSLRQERGTPFAFLPVNCRGITSDEQDLLLALQAAAACDVAALSERAERLTQGGAPIRTSLALGWLAAFAADASGRSIFNGLLN